MILVFIVLFSVLVFISYTDFKERKVFLINLFICFLSITYIHYKNTAVFEVYIYTILLNAFIVGIILSILFLYSRFKLQQKLSNVLGLGDILFFFIIASGFPTVSFLIIFVLSLVFSLILYLVLQTVLKSNTVPLAGLQSVFLLVVLVLNTVFKIVDLYAM